MQAIKKYIDWFIRDRHGKVVIWQIPNWPLILWALFTFLAAVSHGGWQKAFDGLGFAALAVWALLEIFTGHSYFRRVLGVVILAFSIYGRLR